MRYFILSSIFFIIFTGCSLRDDYVMFNQTPHMQTASQPQNLGKGFSLRVDNARFEYKIRPHDRLSIITYRRPELSTTPAGNINANGSLGQSILVNSSGEIRLPLVNAIKVAGLTQSQAQLKIEKAFSEYLKHPSVQLEVLNKRAFVLGEVNRPGPIELQNEQLPLLQLLSIAGDLTPGADRQSIIIMKNRDDVVITKVVSLMSQNAIQAANQMIQPNDVVYVVPKDMTLFNRRIEEINPIFQLISDALTPFLTIRLLTR